MTFYDHKGIFANAKHGGSNIFKMDIPYKDNFKVKKSVMKSISTHQSPCSEKIAYGKLACIEEKVRISRLIFKSFRFNLVIYLGYRKIRNGNKVYFALDEIAETKVKVV